MTWNDFFNLPETESLLSTILLQIQNERKKKTIYPTDEKLFNAFELTPLNEIKIVILGQDPYHGPNQANGLAFSVNKGVAIPPSLKNIYKAISYDYPEQTIPTDGDLSFLAKQGVFLLNATLTVEANEANSHSNIGWQFFTDEVIRTINKHRQGVIFLLWGKYAQKKSALIDEKKHYILKAPHPSPLSAHRGFITCGHFKQSNSLLQRNNQDIINWTM
ncbi:uracil-DNA glycosylase [Thorsellia kenyensis]|uniref:Uracil-DNA glycosylase n=1 Tax=Thorsellia kenyensis TaxID=1549888 RepID=A0ABV6CAH3_9GAMM